MEERIRELEERLGELENARYSVGLVDDDMPGRPVYRSYYEAWQEYVMKKNAYAGDRFRDAWRIWDHSVSPPRDVTKE